MFAEKDCLPHDQKGPDELVDGELWPETRVVPFHYPHPVTGKQVQALDLRAPKLQQDPKEAKKERVIDDAL